jgi:ketosteroid isomerase-like protein
MAGSGWLVGTPPETVGLPAADVWVAAVRIAARQDRDRAIASGPFGGRLVIVGRRRVRFLEGGSPVKNMPQMGPPGLGPFDPGPFGSGPFGSGSWRGWASVVLGGVAALAGCARQDPFPAAIQKGAAGIPRPTERAAMTPQADAGGGAGERLAAKPAPVAQGVRIPEVIRRHRLFTLTGAADPVPAAGPSGAFPAFPLRSPPENRFAAAPAPRIVPIEFPSDRTAAVAEIRDTLRDYLAAFNRHDDAALASYWSESSENIDLDTGRRVDGRHAVRDVFSALFSHDAAAAIDFEIESIRPVAEDVAVVDGISRMSFAEGADAHTRFSAVVVRQGGRWQIDSVREAAAAKQASRSGGPLDSLDWLRGEWEGLDTEKPVAMECHWSAGRAFLVRSHRVQETEAGPAREITEIIGHDPLTGSLRSWIFSSNGGFGEATWQPEGVSEDAQTGGARWTLLVTGTLADGRSVQGSLTITRIGDDGMTCILTGDGLEGLLPPETDAVRVARHASGP